MNIINTEPRNVNGVWLVGVQTPSGKKILINHKGTWEEAIEKAMSANPDPT